MKLFAFALVLFLLILLRFQTNAQNYLQFIENKNQWDSRVLFRADIPSGALFFEKNCLTFNMFNQEDLHKCEHPVDFEGDPGHDEHTYFGDVVHFHAFKKHFVDCNPDLHVVPADPFSHYYNYFLGNDQSKWASRVKAFKTITYQDLYENVNMVVYQDGEVPLKYDLIVYPGGNIDDIRFSFEGASNVYLSGYDLVILTEFLEIRETKPVAYQVIGADTIFLECRYKLKNKQLSFIIQSYNHDYPLIIDPPTLIFSTFSGSYSNNFGYTAAFDSKGNLYSGSSAFGPSYPTSTGAFQTTFGGDNTDMAITKWKFDGTSFDWSTLIGGSDDELPHSIYVSDYNEVFVLGTTGSSNYPVTTGAYDASFNGGTSFTPTGLGMNYALGCDIVVTKIKNDGSSLLGSTFVGGTSNDGINVAPLLRNNYADEMRGEVMLDAEQNVYIVSCTNSSNFPVTAGAFQTTYGGGSQDGCIFKMNNDLTSMIWSSYVGGSNDDAAYSVTLDENEDIFISGGTASTNFPTSVGTIHPTYIGGEIDGFITHVSQTGTLIRSTLYGSNTADQNYFVELDNEGFVYVLGQTYATGTTLVFNAAYSVPNSGHFVAKISPDLNTLEFSTVFGDGSGHPVISPTAFLVDYCNKMYISGWGGNTNALGYGGPGGFLTNFPVTGDAYDTTTDGSDFYILVLEDDASELVYATFMGGSTSSEHVDGGTSRFDRKGKVYEAVCAGCGYPTGYSDFPTTLGVWSNTNNSNCNLAVFKFDFNLPLVVADFDAPYNVCAPYDIAFDNLSLNGDDFLWNFGDGDTSTEFEPTHTYDTPGTYLVTLYVEDTTSCNFGDQIEKYITVWDIDLSMVTDTFICQGESLSLNAETGTSGDQYHWSSNSSFSDMLNDDLDDSDINVSPFAESTYYVSISNAACEFLQPVTVHVYDADFTLSPDTTICLGDTIELVAQPMSSGYTYTYDWSTALYFISDSVSQTAIVNPPENITYTVYVENEYGCHKTQTVDVVVSDVNFSINPTNPNCHGETSGSANVTISSGIAPFDYQWSNDAVSSTVSGLSAGPYALTITDDMGCYKVHSFTLTEPPALVAFISDTAGTLCDGYCIGSATVDVSGGTPSYLYAWIDGQTEPTADSLCAGEYYVTISDDHGCDTILSVMITDPSDLFAAASDTVIPSCFGYCDGMAAVNVSLGTPPYTYSWSNGGTSNTISDLCSGLYTVTVIDAEICIRLVYLYLDQPDPVEGEITETVSMVCNGDVVDLFGEAVGGTPDYEYYWPDPVSASGQNANGLSAGEYSLIITDSHNCKDTVYYTVSEPLPLGYSDTSTLTSCIEACNGTASVSFSGGQPPYSYIWSNGMTSSSIDELCPGVYDVTVTDNLGCSVVLSVDVDVNPVPIPLDVFADDQFLFTGQQTGLHATWDEEYSYTWSPATLLDHPLDANPHTEIDETTTFEVMVFDEDGCANIDSITIFVDDIICAEPYIYVPNAFTPNGDGVNDVLFVYGDVVIEMYFAIYNRWGQKVFESDNIYNGWDGTFNGNELDPAVFDYYLKATCVGKETFEKKGNITLIR